MPTVLGLLGSNTVTGLAETYDNKNAGTNKTLSVSAYTVNDGNGGNNYAVTPVTNTTGVINKAGLTIAAVTNTKTYDGTTSAAATPTVTGLQGTDTVTGLAETYDNKNFGTGQDVVGIGLHGERWKRWQQLLHLNAGEHDGSDQQGGIDDHGANQHEAV